MPIEAISQAGLRIPEDISLVAYNDNTTAQFIVPALTTVKIYMEFMENYCRVND